MNTKSTRIVIILIVIAIAIVVVFGFFGIGGFSLFGTGQSQPQAQTAAQALLNQIDKSGGTVSQLVVEDVTVGTGDSVALGDTLTVNYTGLLTNGTVFDSSDAHGASLTFTIGKGQLIRGWEQGLLGMKEGGRRLLAIPPSMGYGANAVGAIPANSVLIFDVELLKRVPAGTAGSTR